MKIFQFLRFSHTETVVHINFLQAETDRVKGLGIMVFEIEATVDDLVRSVSLPWIQ